ncbi:MAG: glycosyltransferase family 4 protein [Oligoflexia bacterium]|nr:glycosyltransferase family 4 protein [Oligoflexia bacterium]
MHSDPKRLTDLGVLVEALGGGLDGLVVCFSLSWGGLEQVAANDALDAAGLGLKMRVLCMAGSPIHQYLSGRPELEVIPVDYRPRNYFDLRLRKELERLIGAGVNLIHTHQTSLLGSIVPWVWTRGQVAVLASRHIMNNHDKRNFFHGAIYGRLDALLAMSEALRRNILETHRIHERQVKLVRLGLDFDRFDPAKVDRVARRAQWGADPDTVVIGLVGRIDPAKGQAAFLRAAAGLLMGTQPGEKLKFVLVGDETRGSGGGYLAELKQMVSQFRIEEHVVFTGFEENVPEIMNAFDIFAMPSRQEAFGLVAIEAMAMERPVVISSGGSSREIIGNEEFGLFIRPEDAFDLQRQLRHLLDHPEERVKMGQRSREHVRAFFDREQRLRQTLEIYERALRRRRVL